MPSSTPKQTTDHLTETDNKTPAQHRAEHVKAWQNSGLSMSEYCRRNNLPLSKFYSWKKKEIKPQSFKPVTWPIANKAQDKPIIEVVLNNAIRIRVTPSIDSKFVAQLAKELMACS